MPALADYLERYPEVRVDVALTDRVVNLGDEGFEATDPDRCVAGSDLMAKPLAQAAQLVEFLVERFA